MAKIKDAEVRKPQAPRTHVPAKTGGVGMVRAVVFEIGQIFELVAHVVRSAIRFPRGYWADTRDEMYSLLRLCIVPAAFAMIGYGFLVTTFGVGLLLLLGAPNRMGGFWVMADIRELSVFITSMTVAGVIGTSITADIGARRVREELDALQVLGIDHIRLLVLPRVVATSLATVLVQVFNVFVGTVLGLLGVMWLGNTSSGSYMDSMIHNLHTADLWGSLVKTLIIGFLIGVVCSHKGLTAGGGPEGVGRAVNQAVVICFAMVWIVNFFFNATMQGLNPDLQNIR